MRHDELMLKTGGIAFRVPAIRDDTTASGSRVCDGRIQFVSGWQDNVVPPDAEFPALHDLAMHRCELCGAMIVEDMTAEAIISQTFLPGRDPEADEMVRTLAEHFHLPEGTLGRREEREESGGSHVHAAL